MKKRPSPLSIRLSPEDRARLERMAGDQSLSRYIHGRLFNDLEQTETSQPEGSRKRLTDRAALAQALALLGKSRLSESFHAMAEAARIGALPVEDETEIQIHRACAHVSEIKGLLMQALRIKER